MRGIEKKSTNNVRSCRADRTWHKTREPTIGKGFPLHVQHLGQRPGRKKKLLSYQWLIKFRKKKKIEVQFPRENAKGLVLLTAMCLKSKMYLKRFKVFIFIYFFKNAPPCRDERWGQSLSLSTADADSSRWLPTYKERSCQARGFPFVPEEKKTQHVKLIACA